MSFSNKLHKCWYILSLKIVFLDIIANSYRDNIVIQTLVLTLNLWQNSASYAFISKPMEPSDSIWRVIEKSYTA